MTALWIDYWDKRCWVAVEVEWFTFPKAIVPRVKIITSIKKYCEEYSCDTIVVWLPYDLYWKNLVQLHKTEKFINNLKEIFKNKNIVWIDERFTSFEAESILTEFWIRNTRWQKDDISAQIILDSYLWRKNNKKINN